MVKKRKRKQPIQLRRYQAQRKKARVSIKPKTKFRRVPKMIIRPQYTLEELRAVIDTQKSTKEGVLDGLRESIDNDKIVFDEMKIFNKGPRDL